MLVNVYAKGLHRHVSKVFWPNPPIAMLELPNCLSYGCYILILMSFQNISSTNYACCHSQLSSLSFIVVFFLIFFVVEVAVFVAAAVFGVSLAAIVVFVVSLVTFTACPCCRSSYSHYFYRSVYDFATAINTIKS